LEEFLLKQNYHSELERLGIHQRLDEAKTTLAHLLTPAYRTSLVGMLGVDPALVSDAVLGR
jgi:hypothetical protein